MCKRPITPVLFFLFAIGNATISNAALIASGGIVVDDQGFQGLWQFPVNFSVSWAPPNNLGQRASLFDLTLSATDVGTTHVVNSGSEFLDAVSLMTNGVIDWYFYSYNRTDSSSGGLGSGEADFESYLFYGDRTGASGIDLIGFTVTSIELLINDVQLIKPGRDPNGDGNWTDIVIDTTLNVYGEPVPIPSAAWLFGSGLLGLIGAARHKVC